MSKEAMKLALEALEVATTPLANDRQEVLRAQAALREALAEKPAQGCEYCNHPLYAGTKCKNCGRVTEQAAIKRDLTPEQPAQQEPVEERQERRVEAHNNVYATGVTVDRLHFLARQGLHSEGDTVGWYEAYFAIDRLLELAEQPAQQEPVAWVETREDGSIYWGCETDTVISDDPSWLERPVPVYFGSPANKPWIGLTQRDIDIAFDDTQEGGGFNEFARAIEAKLREKNT